MTRDYTTNLNLVKPKADDQYNIKDFNNNMQAIDDFAGLVPPKALTADKLTTSKNINGIAFDGTKNIITGLGLYSETETYDSTNIVYGYIENNLKIFKSLVDNNIGNALTDITHWEEIKLGGGGGSGGKAIGELCVFTHKLQYGVDLEGYGELGTYVYKDPVEDIRYGYPQYYQSMIDKFNDENNTIQYVDVNPVLISSAANAISSGVYSGQPLANAFTDNLTTFWGSSQLGASNINGVAYIGCSDLTQPVTRVKFYNSSENHSENYCLAVKLQYSNDGTNWNDIQTADNLISGWNEITVQPYNSDSVYSFRLLAQDFQGGTSANWLVAKLELYTSQQAQVKVNSSGEMFYNISDKEVIDALYTDTGAAWLYGIDETNERIFMPRAQVNILRKYFTDVAACGNGLSLGWTDGRGGYSGTANGTLYNAERILSCGGNKYGKALTGSETATNTIKNQVPVGLTDEPENSGIIAKTSDIDVNSGIPQYIYIVVGNTSEVISQTVEVTSDSANAPLSFDSETGALKLNIGNGLSVDNDGNLESNGITLEQAAQASMPDFDRYIVISDSSLPSVDVTIPADGWIRLMGIGGANAYIQFLIEIDGGDNLFRSSCAEGLQFGLLPMKKGTVLHRFSWINASKFSSYPVVTFYYAQGAN